MDQLTTLRAFVTAAKLQSFSKAATALGVSCGSVSRAITELEGRVQTRLLHRTTRSVALTEDARSYFMSCSRFLQELDEAQRRITHDRETTAGALRLVVHSMIVPGTLAELLVKYRRVAPRVQLTVSVSDSPVNLFDGRFDLGILPASMVEQTAVIRRFLAVSRRILVASPGYLSAYGTPRTCEHLFDHVILQGMQSLGQGPNPLELVDGEERVQVCSPQCIGGSEVAIRSAVLTGMGIAALPDSMVHADLAAGDLVRVLPACTVAESSVELCLFYLHRDKMSSRCRTFVDLCVDYFKGDAPAMSETSMPREIPGEVALAECGLLS